MSTLWQPTADGMRAHAFKGALQFTLTKEGRILALDNLRLTAD
jgi:hypothetical protein